MSIAPFKLPDKPIVTMLKHSLEVATVSLAVARGDAALRSRPMPERLSDLHPGERQKYDRAAIVALMLVNRDADLYARMRAGAAAGNALADTLKVSLEQLGTAVGLDDGDFETLAHAASEAAINRFLQTLEGLDGGTLQRYLADLKASREGEGVQV